MNNLLQIKKNDKSKESFEKHWNENELEDISSRKIIEARKFLNPIIELKRKYLKILDVGCGDGVHIETINELSTEYKMVGIDVSKKSVVICKKNLVIKKY